MRPIKTHASLAEIFGHRIPAPILFAPIGINKLYTPAGELAPAKVAGELGLPVIRKMYSPLAMQILNSYVSTAFQRPGLSH